MNKRKKFFFMSLIFPILVLICSISVYAESTRIGTVKADVLNFRESPSLDSKILMQLLEGAEVFVIDSSDGWYKVIYDDTTGWVFGEYLEISNKPYLIGVITATDVNVRSGPSTDHYVIGCVNKGDELKVTGRNGEWYSILYEDGLEAWVISDYIRVHESGSSRSYDLGTRIIEYARNLLGTKYLYGGNSPSEGLDCSGFVKYVFNHFNISINRVACDQATQGTSVERAKLRPGDLVFFDTNGGHNYINHVGIYIGNNRFIHASSGKGKVVISDLADFYLNSFMTARRFIK